MYNMRQHVLWCFRPAWKQNMCRVWHHPGIGERLKTHQCRGMMRARLLRICLTVFMERDWVETRAKWT